MYTYAISFRSVYRVVNEKRENNRIKKLIRKSDVHLTK